MKTYKENLTNDLEVVFTGRFRWSTGQVQRDEFFFLRILVDLLFLGSALLLDALLLRKLQGDLLCCQLPSQVSQPTLFKSGGDPVY